MSRFRCARNCSVNEGSITGHFRHGSPVLRSYRSLAGGGRRHREPLVVWRGARPTPVLDGCGDDHWIGLCGRRFRVGRLARNEALVAAVVVRRRHPRRRRPGHHAAGSTGASSPRIGQPKDPRLVDNLCGRSSAITGRGGAGRWRRLVSHLHLSSAQRARIWHYWRCRWGSS